MAANWVFNNPTLGMPPITSTTLLTAAIQPKKWKLGDIQRATDQGTTALGVGEFIYLTGLAATAIGTWVGYNAVTGATILAVANGNYPLAVAMSANLAGYGGWYQISGMTKALGLTSITGPGFLYLTATPGSVDDASVIGDAIMNAQKTATVHVVGTFLDTYSLQRPFVTNRVSLSN